MTTHWTDALVKLDACTEAVEWALTQPYHSVVRAVVALQSQLKSQRGLPR